MIVIDTSIAVKWFMHGEEFESQALNILGNHLNQTTPIIAPDLLSLEIANVFATKSAYPKSEIQEGMQKLASYQLSFIPLDHDTLIKATLLAKKHGTAVYDMLFAVIAKKHRCSLITADQRFIEKTQFSHVHYIGNL